MHEETKTVTEQTRSNSSRKDNVAHNWAPPQNCCFTAASLTFALFVEGGVTATDAAIIVVAGASLVNAAF